jgi:hypothetical protein
MQGGSWREWVSGMRGEGLITEITDGGRVVEWRIV